MAESARSAPPRPLPPLYRPSLLRALAGGYRRGDLLADAQAGLLVAVVALPLSMALAIASGLQPQDGLIAAEVGGILISLFGGSRFQVGGPAGAFVGLCAAGVAQFGPSGLAMAAVMAGILLLAMGLLRLGKAISYIPVPVVVGFTTGIAVVIASTQIGPALDLAVPTVEHASDRVAWIAAHLDGWNWRALAVCGATVALIVGLRRLGPRFPGALVALVVVTAVTWIGSIEVATIQTRFAGGIPDHLPAPHAPDPVLGSAFTQVSAFLDRVRELSGLALAIALLGAIESLLSAVVADGLGEDRHDANSELIGQGIANIITPFFAALPVTGVIARTATNIRAGARTPVAGVLHGIFLLIFLLVAAPLVVHIPMAALAGVLFMVCWGMAELRHWPHILKAGRSDAFLLPMAFGLTVFVDLTWAVIVGVLLAMFFFVRRMSEATEVARQTGTDSPDAIATTVPPGIEVFEVRGPFFFGAATLIRDLDDQLAERPRAMILRLPQVPFIDASAAFALRELVASCRKRGIRFLIADIHTRPYADLERHGLRDLIGDDCVCGSLERALVVAAAP
jgi:SulP family sulfate permease